MTTKYHQIIIREAYENIIIQFVMMDLIENNSYLAALCVCLCVCVCQAFWPGAKSAGPIGRIYMGTHSKLEFDHNKVFCQPFNENMMGYNYIIELL